VRSVAISVAPVGKITTFGQIGGIIKKFTGCAFKYCYIFRTGVHSSARISIKYACIAYYISLSIGCSVGCSDNYFSLSVSVEVVYKEWYIMCACTDIASKIDIFACAPQFGAVQFVGINKYSTCFAFLRTILSIIGRPQENYFILSVSVKVANRTVVYRIVIWSINCAAIV